MGHFTPWTPRWNKSKIDCNPTPTPLATGCELTVPSLCECKLFVCLECTACRDVSWCANPHPPSTSCLLPFCYRLWLWLKCAQWGSSNQHDIEQVSCGAKFIPCVCETAWLGKDMDTECLEIADMYWSYVPPPLSGCTLRQTPFGKVGRSGW